MTQDRSSYRSIMKATSLFGGVQVFTILISIIRSKFIAVLLGPVGMGIAGLLNTTTGLISGITNFGLSTSAVKNVASASGSGDQTRIAMVITILRRLVWITGLLGTLITLLLSPWLSELTFGNKNYTLAFVWVSIALLFNQLTIGQNVLLQGMRKLQYLAKANLSGSTFGLIITVPLYYWFGIDGIVPAIIASSVIALFFSWYFAGKVKIESIKVTKEQTIQEGKDMLLMGFMISLSGLITLGASYIVRIFISHRGGVSEVGLYTAGFAIINTYVGLVLNAMVTDYYPRLSVVAGDNIKSREVINQQAEIAVLLLAPILMAFLVFIQWVVIILYSTRFVAIDAMIHWAALGMLFRAASWSVSFIFLAKGDARLYFWNELAANIYELILNILGYYFWGLAGLGISFLIGFVIYLIQVYIISRIKYKFIYHSTFIRIFCIQLLLAIGCFILIKTLFHTPYFYYIGSLLIVASSVYSLKELNKRLELISVIKSLLKK